MAKDGKQNGTNGANGAGTSGATAASAWDDVASLLRTPGGAHAVRREGEGFVAESGDRFAIENGILRTLGVADPALAREIAAQAAAVDDYADPRLLMPKYEHSIARAAVRQVFSGVKPGGRVLDLGCGIGLVGRLFPDLGLIGVDVSIPLLERVTTGYVARVEASAEALPFADQSFDAVLTLNMLHHVVSPERALQEVARVIKPGGLLVSVDPRKVAPIELAKHLLRSNDPTFAPTHKAFGVEEYEDILRAGGKFRIEQMDRIGLVSLLGMGGLDALRLSRFISRGDDVVRLLTAVDGALFSLPMIDRAGLNLTVRARRV